MRHVIVVLGALCFLVGCAQKKAVERPPQDEPYQFESEGKIPPLDTANVKKEVDKVDTFEEMPVEDESVSVESVQLAAPVVTAAPEDITQVMDGYRVQVFASGEEASAKSVRDQAAASLGVPAYLEDIDGVFKVRVGDCPSRAEADALVKRCRSAGYEDAWVVRTQIIVKKPPQQPAQGK